MISELIGIDNMKNCCEKPAEIRSCLVQRYVKKQSNFDLGAMCLPIPPCGAFKYYLCGSPNAFRRFFPIQNRMKRIEAQGAHLLIHDYRLSGGGFLFRVRRNEEIRV